MDWIMDCIMKFRQGIFVKFSILFLILFIIEFTELNSKLIINEFQAVPNGEEPEWIELYNKKDSLESLYFNDTVLLSDSRSTKSLGNVLLMQDEYLIVSRDTSLMKEMYQIPISTRFIELNIPSLNNTTDKIIIRHQDSTIIDSVYYDLKWGEKGKSFERVDPDSNATSSLNLLPSKDLAKATPGKRNSVFLRRKDITHLYCEPNPFAPNSKDIDNKTTIYFKLPYIQSKINARIFDQNGLEVRYLLNNELFNDIGVITWDGLNNNSNPLPIGPYILYLQANDIATNEYVEEKLLIVIGSK